MIIEIFISLSFFLWYVTTVKILKPPIESIFSLFWGIISLAITILGGLIILRIVQ